MTNKRILSIGDIHGLEEWKLYTHGSYENYEEWRELVSKGVSPLDARFNEYPYMNIDKIIFIGDYVDAFEVDNIQIKHNLLNIINFKKLLPDKIVLLWGNHDWQYIHPCYIIDGYKHESTCSGFRSSMKDDLFSIFSLNYELFTFAHQETDSKGKIWLWTHAGVIEPWYEALIKDFSDENFRFKEHYKSLSGIVEILNFAGELNHCQIHNTYSFIWVRPKYLKKFNLEGYNQVVGHTKGPDIIQHTLGKDVIYFIDCMPNKVLDIQI